MGAIAFPLLALLSAQCAVGTVVPSKKVRPASSSPEIYLQNKFCSRETQRPVSKIALLVWNPNSDGYQANRVHTRSAQRSPISVHQMAT